MWIVVWIKQCHWSVMHLAKWNISCILILLAGLYSSCLCVTLHHVQIPCSYDPSTDKLYMDYFSRNLRTVAVNLLGPVSWWGLDLQKKCVMMWAKSSFSLATNMMFIWIEKSTGNSCNCIYKDNAIHYCWTMISFYTLAK